MGLPVIHIQAHRHNRVVPSARAVAPRVVLRAVLCSMLLLVLRHHFNLLRPPLRAVLIKLAWHGIRHGLLATGDLLRLHTASSLLVHRVVLRLRQCWVHERLLLLLLMLLLLLLLLLML